MKILVLVTLVVGALGSTGVAAAKTSPLAGDFEVALKGSLPQLDGVWLMHVAANGAYTIVRKPATTTVLIRGVSTVSGHTFTLVDKAGPLACQGSQARGSYSYTLSGKTLTLKVGNDKCVGRRAVLATSTFTKTH